MIVAGQQARSLMALDPYLGSAHATELPKPYVKASFQALRAEDVPQLVARAYYTAMQAPCGPVLVSVPVDDWDRPASRVPWRTVSPRVAPDPRWMAGLADALNRARRPAFVVGPSVDREQAWETMVALAERHQAAVHVAPFSARCSFPEDHPLFQGFLPAARERIVELLGGHDVIVVVGAAAFVQHIEGAGSIVPADAQLFQVTEDPDAAHWAPEGSAAVGDVALALQSLLQQSHPVARVAPAPRPEPAPLDATEPMSVGYVLQTLAQLRDADAIVVEEAPSSRVVMHVRLPILRPGTFYTMASGGLGYGMPAAVGVAMARPGQRVICVIGDGSTMYSPQALWSAAQHRLDITFVVINNGGYGAMQRFAGLFQFPAGRELPGVKVSGLDFVGLAQAQGCAGARVTQAAELPAAMRRALTTPGPQLLEVVVASAF